jgi:DNA replication and repair protein RecF
MAWSASGEPALEVFVEWEEAGSSRTRRAAAPFRQRLEGRLDGQDVPNWGTVRGAGRGHLRARQPCLVDGGAENRRRFLDWGLFHVEPDFLSAVAALRPGLEAAQCLAQGRGAADAQLDAWDHELAEAGEA